MVAVIAPVGTELFVNTLTTGGQNDPSIAGLSNGRFVVTWYDTGTPVNAPNGANIKVQIYNADGTKFGTEFRANTLTVNNATDADVTALSDGRFLISTLYDYAAKHSA